jgi:hypothetical protein
MAKAKKTLVGALESLPPVLIYQYELTMTESEARLLVEALGNSYSSSVRSTIGELAISLASKGDNPYEDSASLESLEFPG